ncbi:MAG TPA: hypothetical protein VEX15_20715 [Nocardioidaceae bacterium]|nr:hypothetical protein [Nocardioidaceae bacterium]
MPRRALAVAFITAFFLVAFGTPATAKGPDSATISGPAIRTTQLTWDGPHLESFLQATRFWDATVPAGWENDPPDGDLGPRFDVVYHVPDLDLPSRKGQLVRQELYPFAAAGPVVHMAEGQTMYGIDLASGWLSTDRRLTAVVKRLGGTAQPVLASPIEAAAHEETVSSEGPAWRLAAVGAVGTVLVATAMAVLLRRRVRGPA